MPIPTHTPTVYDGRRPRRTRRRVIVGAVATVATVGLVLGAASAAGASTAVPRGTTVLGIDIGGRDQAEASQALLAGLGDRLAEGVPVKVGDKAATVDPAAVGLHLDAAATVDRAASGWPNPFKVLFGGETEVDPVVAVDADKLDATLAKPVSTLNDAAKPAAVIFEGTTPKASYGVTGVGLDSDGAVEALRTQWLRSTTIAVPLTEKTPTPKAEVDRVVNELARPAVAAPVTVRTERGELTIGPKAIARSLIITADHDGRLNPVVEEKKLRSAMEDELSTVEIKPRDASIAAGSGAPKIIASTGGRLVDTAKLSRDLIPVLPTSGPRTLSADIVTVDAKTTATDLANQGIVERISSFTTYYKGGQDRNKNIIQVAKKVDGAIVKPGETFSLNGFSGPRGYAEGYVDAPIIQGGKLVNAVGGGISQFTTTLFNAMYYAGLEDVEHHPHSYYFSRYPSVIESTIFMPSLDMKFRNDSAHSVLIDTSYNDTSITVTMWSTKRYDISTDWSSKRNITSPKTVHLKAEKGCIATTGLDGFSQDAWRIFKQNRQEIKREKFSHTYKAEPRFVCDG